MSNSKYEFMLKNTRVVHSYFSITWLNTRSPSVIFLTLVRSPQYLLQYRLITQGLKLKKIIETCEVTFDETSPKTISSVVGTSARLQCESIFC